MICPTICHFGRLSKKTSPGSTGLTRILPRNRRRRGKRKGKQRIKNPPICSDAATAAESKEWIIFFIFNLQFLFLLFYFPILYNRKISSYIIF
jgi:hypothetical protein